MSDYTAQILVSRPRPVEVMGYQQHFRTAPDGPLTEGLEARAAEGWSADELAGWIMGALDDPEIVVAVDIREDFEGWMVTATVGRALAGVV